MKKLLLFVSFILVATFTYAQSIHEYNYNVNSGMLGSNYNTPGNIIYPYNYTDSSSKTPVVFVHGITGKVSNSYKANINQVMNYHLKAAFVQLNPLGTPEQNGKLLKRMIDHITAHFGSATVSIVAHSKGGMDTERALYGRNPYNTSIPSFGYEKVDGVYTLSSPLQGARVADVGASLSWTGIAFIAMWYANGYQLTSGSVNSFHNWARGWRINSNGTFRNAYHPNGASYSRINMTEDNTTRWWAHQSNDPCYQNKWYFCYVGNAFHHSAGAYYDAYWQWAGFHSGWRNWHTSNDGFISEYRAKRSVITDASNALTPGAGDTNYRVMHDANHTSLWERGENHFSREIAPYLHYGLYNSDRRPQVDNDIIADKEKVDTHIASSVLMRSQGNTYFSKNGSTTFVIEEDNQPINLIFYTASPITHFELTGNNRSDARFEIINSKKDDFTSAYESVAYVSNLPKGVYTLQVPEQEFMVMAAYDDTKTAFAVHMNFDEKEGYNGQDIEVAIANANQAIDFSKVQVSATLSKISEDGDTPMAVNKITHQTYNFTPMNGNSGHFVAHFDNLTPGAVYGMRIEAVAHQGVNLLARNVIHTFYVTKPVQLHDAYVTENTNTIDQLTDEMVSLFPNPASKEFHINMDESKDAKVLVYNEIGVLVGAYAMSGTQKTIDVSHWTKGMYLVKVQTEKGVVVKQLIIK